MSANRANGSRRPWRRSRFPPAHLAGSEYLPLEFAGVRSGWLFPRTRVVPARDVRFDEEKELIRLEHPRAFINKAPHSNPKAELAEIEKEEIDACYGYFVPLRRTSNIKELRPEDALNRPGLSVPTATVDELLLHGEGHGARS